jgi:hypothetical protein
MVRAAGTVNTNTMFNLGPAARITRFFQSFALNQQTQPDYNLGSPTIL